MSFDVSSDDVDFWHSFVGINMQTGEQEWLSYIKGSSLNYQGPVDYQEEENSLLAAVGSCYSLEGYNNVYYGYFTNKFDLSSGPTL